MTMYHWGGTPSTLEYARKCVADMERMAVGRGGELFEHAGVTLACGCLYERRATRQGRVTTERPCARHAPPPSPEPSR